MVDATCWLHHCDINDLWQSVERPSKRSSNHRVTSWHVRAVSIKWSDDVRVSSRLGAGRVIVQPQVRSHCPPVSTADRNPWRHAENLRDRSTTLVAAATSHQQPVVGGRSLAFGRVSRLLIGCLLCYDLRPRDLWPAPPSPPSVTQIINVTVN